MKKILFLLLICLIKLNAFEYLICTPKTSYGAILYYFNSDGGFFSKVIQGNNITVTDLKKYKNIYRELRNIKYQISTYNDFITSSEFYNLYANNLVFLNLLYTYSEDTRNSFMNYLYNKNQFDANDYIIYEDYELLYNSDGLAVESIVNGVWAGLYDDSERGSSGRLYDSSGVLLYVNAEPVNTFQQWLDPFIRSVVGCLMAAVNLIASPVGVVISVVFVMAILYFVVTVGRRAIQPFEGKVRKRFLGSHNEEV